MLSVKLNQTVRAPFFWLALFLLWALFTQAAFTAARTSLTTDEGLHITSGYSILRTGDFRLIEEHPPLIKVLAALPLLPVRDLADPRTLPSWESKLDVSDTVHLVRVMKEWLQPYRPFDRIVYAARVPIMLLSLLLGAVAFRWATDLQGPKGGLIALGLYAFDPNILAHSSVAAIDLGTAAFIFFASYTFWRALRRPTRANVVLAGVTLGLAQASKISALILLPLFVILACPRALTAHDPVLFSRLHVRDWARTTKRGQMLVRTTLLVSVIFVLAFMTLWTVYGFEVRTPPGWRIPVLAASHLIPLDRVRHDVAAGRTTFLMGQYSEHGWWYYFPVAFAIKTPLPTLICLGMAVLSAVVSASRLRGVEKLERLRHWAALLLFPLAYFAIALIQPFNIGYRHLLPVLPFVFAFTGAQIAYLLSRITYHAPVAWSPGHLVTWSLYLLVTALSAWYITSTVHIFPNYLAYFNELAGGPDGGYRYLVDSNLDWGQAWKDLKVYLDTHGIARVKLAQFSSNDPAVYGIDYEPIAPMTGAPPVLPARFNPAPGVYVLSASSLQGVPLADVDTYDYFRHRLPTARIGHAMFLYDVRPVEPPPDWVALCTAPAPPLELPDITEGFGRGDWRAVYFDCQQAWVLPGNAVNGWFVLPYALAHDKNTFAGRWLNQARLAFEQKQSFALPPHSIFLSSSGGTLPVIKGMIPVSATFGEAAQLLGYTLDRAAVRPGQSVELLTLWRVIGNPPGPLSVMAHLLASDGRAIAVGDGLGFTAEQWQVGDLFIQRSQFRVPADTPRGAFAVQTGLYTWGDVRRLSVTQNGIAAGDSLRLAQLSVRP